MSAAEPYLTLMRHGESDYNVQGRLNGDPAVPVHLTAAGRAAARALGTELAGTAFDLAVHTRFARSRETLEILLAGRDIPTQVLPELDDVQLGEFEGHGVEEYRAWRRMNGVATRPAGGESRLDALARYADGFERLVGLGRVMLCVTHDIPIRFLANAIQGADPLEGPVRSVANLVPFRLSDAQVTAAVVAMRRSLQP